jgi:hypothetical protein
LKPAERSKGSRVQGFERKAKKYSRKGPQSLLAGDLGFIEKSELGTKKHRGNRKNVNGADKVFRE